MKIELFVWVVVWYIGLLVGYWMEILWDVLAYKLRITGNQPLGHLWERFSKWIYKTSQHGQLMFGDSGTYLSKNNGLENENVVQKKSYSFSWIFVFLFYYRIKNVDIKRDLVRSESGLPQLIIGKLYSNHWHNYQPIIKKLLISNLGKRGE